MNEELYNFLLGKIFYFCQLPSYTKWGIWTFEPDGKIKGMHSDFEQTWKIENEQLLILDSQGHVTCIFEGQIEKMQKSHLLRPGMENFQVALIATDLISYDYFDTFCPIENDLIAACMETGSVANEKLRQLIFEDKTIDGYYASRAYAVQRKDLEIGLKQYKGVFYDLEVPQNQPDFFTKKLLVWFPGLLSYNHGNARENFFPNPFEGITDSIAKNTVVLRIADSNLINGSYYLNTPNFGDYEQNIQELIEKTAKEEGILRENILCAGSSRGGMGALYHGLLGNYALVSMDPVVDRSPWLQTDDVQLMFDCIPVSFVDKLNQLLEKTKLSAEKIQVITSPQVPITYPFIIQLKTWKLVLNTYHMRLSDEQFDYQPYGGKMHGDFVNRNIPLLLMKINEFLYGCDLIEDVID
ncbi:XcbB/CpsF family capsular polysaccharide biosynthesis protein [Lactococcus lactis]|uniref:XcbB/CpsF family capsular polysaccharide biosynthesis protein n=1 Tax=Lactococcus lactis TaxID=1358 RepID=UPI001F52ECFF|nr:XcbB/CpsF family capsular polysaccharide biosynthesis protein [Lactococcus lactis]MCI1071245.1 XcbB/CpsF family capsular polysaccharide biosynthesis protein [Lactococcus lactis]